jgi:hypothetical protein
MLEAGVRYVSVLILNVEAEDFDAMTREASMLIRRKGASLDGLVECIVLGSEDKKQILVVAQWATRDSWSAAQWDEDIGLLMADIFEAATSVEVHAYEPITIVRPATR